MLLPLHLGAIAPGAHHCPLARTPAKRDLVALYSTLHGHFYDTVKEGLGFRNFGKGTSFGILLKKGE